jgi:tetratricopeptide (TPR) repeat protein
MAPQGIINKGIRQNDKYTLFFCVITMTTEDEQIKEFIQKPGLRMEFRRAIYSAQKLKGVEPSDEEARKKVLTNFAFESNFLLNRELDFGFYRFVRKRVLSRKDWFNNQLREIGYLVLLDLLHPEKAVPYRAADKKTKNVQLSTLKDKWQSDRSLRRIRKDHPEIFFNPLMVFKKGRGKLSKKEKRYSTTFSAMSEIGEEEGAAALQFLLTQDAARLPFEGMVDRIHYSMAALRLVEPTDITCLERFWEYQKASLQIINGKYGQAEENTWLVPNIEQGGPALEFLFQLIENAIALKWYRTIKSATIKEQLLKRKYPVKYTRKDAENAIRANLRWIKNPVKIADYVFKAGDAFAAMGEYDSSIYLHEECLKMPNIESIDKGLCFHNIACNFRLKNKPKKFLIYLKKALAVFEEIRDAFDVGMEWAFIAKAYHFQGNSEKEQEAIAKSKKTILDSDLSDFMRTKAFLWIVDEASEIENRAWEQYAIENAFKSASKLENTTYADALMKVTYYVEDELWELAERIVRKIRPPFGGWSKQDSNMFVPLVSS